MSIYSCQKVFVFYKKTGKFFSLFRVFSTTENFTIFMKIFHKFTKNFHFFKEGLLIFQIGSSLCSKWCNIVFEGKPVVNLKIIKLNEKELWFCNKIITLFSAEDDILPFGRASSLASYVIKCHFFILAPRANSW